VSVQGADRIRIYIYYLCSLIDLIQSISYIYICVQYVRIYYASSRYIIVCFLFESAPNSLGHAPGDSIISKTCRVVFWLFLHGAGKRAHSPKNQGKLEILASPGQRCQHHAHLFECSAQHRGPQPLMLSIKVIVWPWSPKSSKYTFIVWGTGSSATTMRHTICDGLIVWNRATLK